MGVNLSELVKTNEIEMDRLGGRRVAVDAYNTLYQFLSIIRDRFTGEPLKDSKGRVTSHLSGLFYRTTRMIEAGVDPVFVFDGKPPPFKKETSEKRSEIKKEAEKKLEEAREEGDREAIRRYAQATSRLTDDMIENAKKLLELMGIPVVQAVSEGEAEAARMVNSGKAWASGSQDWDSLLFGAKRMVRNLTITGKRKVPRKHDYVEIKPEIIEMDSVLSGLGINHEQLITIGMLIGTDYNPGGVRGVGPKTALKLVREHKTFDKVMKQVEWEFETEPKEIFGFFLNPPSNGTETGKVKLQPDRLREFMLDFDFSEGRTDKVIERLRGSSKEGKLTRWFK